MTRSYSIRTYGCQMNEHDSERIAGLLEADGLVLAATEAQADVVVVNTCCIREGADTKTYGNLGHLKSWKDQVEGRQLIVAGCMAQKDRDLIRQRAPWVDVVLGTHNVHRAGELIHVAQHNGPITEIFDAAVLDDELLFPSALPARRETSFNAWVTIQIGCDNSCAFCIVPAVRGAEISRPFQDVVDEVTALAAQGVTEVTLLGQNVNSYGRDLTLSQRRDGNVAVKIRPLFPELLRAVGSIPGIRRVRFTSPHPKDMRGDCIQAMAETPAVCEHLHYPLQAGSDRVLTAMHRGYTAAALPGTSRAGPLGSCLTWPSVPTSSWRFRARPRVTSSHTLEVAAAAEFDYAYTFIFSPRPGTQAAQLFDQFIAADVARDRFDRLKAVVERSALIKHTQRIGRIEEVLVEGPSRKNAGVMTARSRQNKLVHFAAPTPMRAGTYASVLITDAAPHHLSGQLVEVLADATHKTRIAVVAG